MKIAGDQSYEIAGAEIWMDDVTGDGIGDLLIGRQNHTPAAGRAGAGALTIIVGGSALKTHAATLSYLDLRSPPIGIKIVTIVGISAYDRLGIWMRTGDVDGDGVADLAVGGQPLDRGHGRLQRRRAAPMQQIEVDAIGAEAPQAALAGGDGTPARGVVRVDLADDEDLVAAPGDGFAHHLLGAAFAVHLGGVDEAHAEVEPESKRRHLCLALALAPVAAAYVVLYSFAKYYTWACHFFLGWALAISPSAAWIAVTGRLDPEAVLLSVVVALVLTLYG